MITPAIPTPSDDPVLASIVLNQDTHSIRYSSWQEAVLLDQVMSVLAGQPALTPDETLQRLIDEELVLHAIPPEAPTTAQVEAQIAALQQTWGVDDATVVAVLEQVGLTRATLEQAIGRSLTVQASLDALQSQGYDTTAWLEEQRASAEIVLNEEFKEEFKVVVPYVPVAQSSIATPATSPLPVPATETPVPSPILAPATEMPPPTPALAIPKVAPDFTLQRSGGGTLTLSEQLAQGPVVLVFFQSGGG